MAETTKSNHITIVANDTGPTEGRPLRRFGSKERKNSDAGIIFRRTKTQDSEADIGTGFDKPRRGDFASKQIFHGWKLIL
jgi:hypothetical protein